MSIMNSETALAPFQAFDAQCHAENRAYTIPATVKAAWEMKHALSKLDIAAAQPTVAPLPDKPADLAKALDKGATAAAADAHRTGIVTRWRDQADVDYVQQVKDALPAWISALCLDYLTEVDALRTLNPERFEQTDITRLSVNAFADYQQALRHVEQLEQILDVRASFAALGGENRAPHANLRGISGAYGRVHLALALQAPTITNTNNPADAERQFQYRDRIIREATGLGIFGRWVSWTRAASEGWATLTLPRHNEVEQHLILAEGLLETGIRLQMADKQSLTHLMSRSDSTYATVTEGAAQFRQYGLDLSNRPS